MNKQNTAALVIAAPRLYRLYGNTESGWSIQYGFSCGDGWFDILMHLSVKMEAELQAMVAAGKRKRDLPVAHQVKEKFGKLRFYVGGQPAHWREWIEEAFAKSGLTCERCGAPGFMHQRGGFLQTLCPACAKSEGFEPIDLPEPEEVWINGVRCVVAPVVRSPHSLGAQARAAFLSARPLLLLNPRSLTSVEIAAPADKLPIIERMADRMEAELKRLVEAGLPIEALPMVTRIAVSKKGSLAVDIQPGTLPKASEAEFDSAITEAVVALGQR